MLRPPNAENVDNSDFTDQVPWSESLTEYDHTHFTTYMRLLDASADNARADEMAKLILGVDPVSEPNRAKQMLKSHLDRANWMVCKGYKELFPEGA